VVEPVALQRVLIFWAMIAEMSMLIGIAQFALRPPPRRRWCRASA